MNFWLTEEQEAFRKEIRQFLKAELPSDWSGVTGPTMVEFELDRDDVWEVHKTMACKLGEKGWLALSWPAEYGGQAKSHIEHAIFSEEMAYHRSPGINTIGVEMVAPTLIVCGTEGQKEKHLRPLARGETFWCEGFSEPEAGSDLGSVRTRAVEKEDAFYIDGQKVWTTLSQRSGWCALLARTDPEAPKHRGISFFLVDLKSPGVTINPMEDASDGSELTEVFFDNVRVPKENLVGERNQGWGVAMTLLSFERSGAGWIGTLRRLLDDIAGYFREIVNPSEPTSKSRLIRHRLAEMAIQVEISRLLSYRIAWMQDKGLNPESDAALMKVYSTETMQELANIGTQLLGLYGQLGRDLKWAPLKGVIEHCYVCTIGPKIAGGTSEVQRNVIALRGLGLPR